MRRYGVIVVACVLVGSCLCAGHALAESPVEALPARCLSANTRAVVSVDLQRFSPEQIQKYTQQVAALKGLADVSRNFLPLRQPLLESGVTQLVVVVNRDTNPGKAPVLMLCPPDEEADVDRLRQGLAEMAREAGSAPPPVELINGWVRIDTMPLPVAADPALVFHWQSALESHDDEAVIAITALRQVEHRLPVEALLRQFNRQAGEVEGVFRALGVADVIVASIDWDDDACRLEARFRMETPDAAGAVVREYGVALRGVLNDVRLQGQQRRQHGETKGAMRDEAFTGLIARGGVLALFEPVQEQQWIAFRSGRVQKDIYMAVFTQAMVASMIQVDQKASTHQGTVRLLGKATQYYQREHGEMPREAADLWPLFGPLVDEVQLDPVTGRKDWFMWRPQPDDPATPLLIVSGDDPRHPEHPYLDAAGRFQPGGRGVSTDP